MLLFLRLVFKLKIYLSGLLPTYFCRSKVLWLKRQLRATEKNNQVKMILDRRAMPFIRKTKYAHVPF